MRINKTARKVGFHKLSLPKPPKPKLIKVPKTPNMKVPKSMKVGYGM